jgi:glucosamine--fructose-6-phosphate aminotransferase (isomerizing)
MAGQQVLSEMGEQPAVLAAIAAQRSSLHAAIRAALPTALRGICLVARGSSDNVATHARYLLELATGVPVSMAAPSVVTRYGVTLHADGYLVVALSQSGRTPEIVSVSQALKDQGACVVAVTNEIDSPLAEVAAVALSVGTSKELAVPATKTVTGQLALVTLLAEAVGDGIGDYTGGDAAWSALPDVVAGTLADTASIDRAVEVLQPHRSAIHLARGLTYAAALEGALKSKETSRRVHDGYSSADFLHGPLTVAGPGVPIIGYGAAGPVLADVVETVGRSAALGSPIVGVGAPEVAASVPGAVAVPVPAGLGEALAAIPLVVRGQQLAIATTIALGMDPDSPEGLNKVTATH